MAIHTQVLNGRPLLLPCPNAALKGLIFCDNGADLYVISLNIQLVSPTTAILIGLKGQTAPALCG